MDRWTKFVGIGSIGLALSVVTGAMARPHDNPPDRRDDRRCECCDSMGDRRDDRRHDDRRPDDRRPDRNDRHPDRPEMRREGPIQEMRQMMRDLNLDDSQREAVREIFKDSRQEARRIMEDDSDPEQRQEALRSLVKRVEGDVASKLNDEQRGKFNSRLEKIHERRAKEREAARFPMIQRLDDALHRVNLTEEQRPQIDELLANLRKRVEDIRFGAREEDPQLARDEIQKLIQESHKKLDEILTPEQRDELRNEMRPRAEDRRFDRREDREEQMDRRPRERRDHERRPERRPHRPIRPV